MSTSSNLTLQQHLSNLTSSTEVVSLFFAQTNKLDVLVTVILELGAVVVALIGFLGARSQFRKNRQQVDDLATRVSDKHETNTGLLHHIADRVSEMGMIMTHIVRTQDYGVMRFDVEGICLEANPAAVRILGINEADLTSGVMGWMDAVHVEDLIRVHHDWMFALSSGRKFGPTSVRCVNQRTNEDFLTRISGASVISRASGKIVSWVVTINPVVNFEENKKELSHE